MILRRLRLSILVGVLSACFLTPGATRPAGTAAPAAAAAPANWTFSGCWTQFSAGQCRDIYVDAQGGHWICRDCGTTRNPGPGKCNPISSNTLASGFWCS